MFFFDPLYLILILPGMLIAGWATLKVKTTFARFSRVRSASGLSGAQVARAILDRNGLQDVPVELSQGMLSDHYDPRKRVLRLSPEVYRVNSVAAIGVAAHETGHALQHQQHYAPLALRSALVPVATLGSNAAWIFLILGGATGALGLMKFGVLLFAGAVAFSIITLPVEFNASTRAKAMLTTYGIVSGEEAAGVSKVLSAAAMTYVAGAIMALLQLLYFAIRAGLLGGRRD